MKLGRPSGEGVHGGTPARAHGEEANQLDLGSSGLPPEAQTGMPVRSLHRGQEVNLILKS